MSGFDRSRLDDLPAHYLEVIENYEKFKRDTNSSDGTVPTVLNRVTSFFEWLVTNFEAPPIDEIDANHATRFDKHLQIKYSDSTHRQRIITLNSMYTVIDYLDNDIWTKPIAGLPDSEEVRNNRKHSGGLDISDMAEFFLSLRDPLWHAFFLFLLKTLARNQEATNVRLAEVHISDPMVTQLYNDLDITLHSAVANHPDTIFIPSTRDGNKRKSSSRIPIDSELKAALIRWLAVRPNTESSVSEPRPLFVSLGDNWGKAQSHSMVSHEFDSCAPESWRTGNDPFVPHDFRHWTNRKLRGGITDHCLSYLRGDSPDMLDHYDDLIAEYERRVRQPYLRNIPSVYL